MTFLDRLRGIGAPSEERPPQPEHARPGRHCDYLFVVTYGRSGSTLLMGLLDSLPGFDIRGENANVVYELFRFHQKASKASMKWSGPEPLKPSHPWYGIDGYPQDLAIERLRALVVDTVIRPGPDTRVAGFKEIRWYMAGLDAYMAFLEQLFPGARFILNTRNHEDVAKSSWWKRAPDAREQLAAMEENMKRTVMARGERAYHLHYDDYVRDPGQLRHLCEWLGVEYDPERFATVMQTKHTTRRTEPETPQVEDAEGQ